MTLHLPHSISQRQFILNKTMHANPDPVMPTYSYFDSFSIALTLWPSMGMTRAPLVTAEQPSPELVQQAYAFVHEQYHLWRTSMPEYLGNQCMDVTTRLYGLLNSRGIKADIVIGSVRTQQSQFFNCDVPYLRDIATQLVDETAPIDLHAWITVGGDSVIDFALPSKLARNHGAPADLMNEGFCADATGMAKHMGLYYEPLLVGSQYLALVNSVDPHDLLLHLLGK